MGKKRNSKTLAIALCMTTMINLYGATPAWAAGVYETIEQLETHVNDVTSDLQAQIDENKTNINDLNATVGAIATLDEAKINAIVNAGTNISELQTKVDDLEGQINALETTVGDSNDGLVKDVATNADAITKLNGDANTDGSVAKQVADAKNDINSVISGKVTEMTNALNQKADVADVADLQGQIDANEAAIATLNGDVTVDGSVKQRVAEVRSDLSARMDNMEDQIDDIGGIAGAIGSNVSSNTTRLNILTGEETVDGSVRNTAKQYADAAQAAAIGAAATDATDKANQALSAANAYTNGVISGKVTEMTNALNQKANVADVNTLKGKVTIAESDIEALKNTVGDESSGLVKGVADNVAAIDKLNGTGEGSVAKQVADAKAAAATDATTKANAAQAAAKDYTDALANGQVATNTGAIAAINNVDTGILAQAKAYATNKANEAQAAAEATAAADATTKANQAESNAKNYADGLNTEMDARMVAAEDKTKHMETDAQGNTYFHKDTDNQVVINENGLKVGLNSTHIDGHSVQINDDSGVLRTRMDENDISIVDAQNAGNRINLSDLGQIDEVDSELRAQAGGTVVGAINAEAAARREQFARIDSRIDQVDKRLDKVGAMSAAIANLRTMGYDPAAPSEFAMSLGHYRGETGMAIGFFHYPHKDFMLSLSVSGAGDEYMGGVGATWKFGYRSPERMAEIERAKVAKAKLEKALAEAKVKEAQANAAAAAQSAKHAKMIK